MRWGSLGDLAAANVSWRLEGDLLRLRPYSRQVTVEVPPEANEVVVEPPWNADGELIQTSDGAVPADEPFEINGPGPLDLRLTRPDGVTPRNVPAPPRRLRPLIRRLAGETRDRVAPARPRL